MNSFILSRGALDPFLLFHLDMLDLRHNHLILRRDHKLEITVSLLKSPLISSS